MPDRPDFARVAEPLRRELFVHCYRMLGSVHDAEDQVQETFLRGWRAYAGFEGRSSVRVWLYRIATNACLRTLEQSARRALPADLTGAVEDPGRPLDAGTGRGTWLTPLPDDPAEVAAGRDRVRLALVAAWQHLPPRQRATLILRDVAGLSAAEVAGVLSSSVAAVNSALQRARATLAELRLDAEEQRHPGDAALLDAYVDALVRADLPTLEKLLAEDVALEMPPHAEWYRGRATVLTFLAARILDRPGRLAAVPTTANGRPAFGVYLDGEAHALHLPGTRADAVDRLYFFLDPALFPVFGLAPVSSGGRADQYG